MRSPHSPTLRKAASGFQPGKTPKSLAYASSPSSQLAWRRYPTLHPSHPQSLFLRDLYTLELYIDPLRLRTTVPGAPDFPCTPPVVSRRLRSPACGQTFYSRLQPVGGTDYPHSCWQGFPFRACALLGWPVPLSPKLDLLCEWGRSQELRAFARSPGSAPVVCRASIYSMHAASAVYFGWRPKL